MNSKRATRLVYTDRRVGARASRGCPGVLREDSSLLREGIDRACPFGLLAGTRPSLAPRAHPGDRNRSGANHGSAFATGAFRRHRYLARDALLGLPAVPGSIARLLPRRRHAPRRLRLPLRPHPRAKRSFLSLDLRARPPAGLARRRRSTFCSRAFRPRRPVPEAKRFRAARPPDPP